MISTVLIMNNEIEHKIDTEKCAIGEMAIKCNGFIQLLIYLFLSETEN